MLQERSSVAVWRPSDSTRILVEVLGRGGVLAIPTESSYALAADPENPAGVATVDAIKKRSKSKPLPVVVGDLDHLTGVGVKVPSEGLHGLEKVWPGALSILLPCARRLPAAAGTGSLAVRIPGHEGLRWLLRALKMGLTATSANRSGEKPILDPVELAPLLAGRDAIVVDAGRLPGGLPSTLIEIDRCVVRVLRPGRIPLEALRRSAPGLEFRDPRSAALAGAVEDRP